MNNYSKILDCVRIRLNEKQEADERQRDSRFDFLYTIGIIAVVSGHVGEGVSLFYDWFTPYSFHLPLFMFCSGYFFMEKSTENVWRFILNKFSKLIIPLYLWNFFYGFLVQLSRGLGFSIGNELTARNLLLMPLISNHQFLYNSANWFVVPLFCIQVFNVIVRKIVKKNESKFNELLLLFLYFLIGLCGICLIKYYDWGQLVGWTLFIVRFMCYLPFYEFGIFYKKVIENKLLINNYLFMTIIFLIQLIIFSYYGRQPVWGFGSRASEFDEWMYLFYIEGVLGISFWLRIANIFKPLLVESRVVRLVGRNTYSIMVNQYLGFMLVKSMFFIIKSYTAFCKNFDIFRYKNDISYYYLPVPQWAIIYIVVGIGGGILIQLIINNCKSVIYSVRCKK